MLKIWTDGSCLGNPGPGGWGFVATDGKNIAERSGGEKNTTNNRMELMAVIRALTAAKNHSELEIHTDSQYVKNGMQSWIKNWKKNNWKTSGKDDVKNKQLWEELYALTQKHKVKFIKVKGHSDNEYNNRCDYLATNAIKELI